jgi:hypothetical protein
MARADSLRRLLAASKQVSDEAQRAFLMAEDRPTRAKRRPSMRPSGQRGRPSYCWALDWVTELGAMASGTMAIGGIGHPVWLVSDGRPCQDFSRVDIPEPPREQ